MSLGEKRKTRGVFIEKALHHFISIQYDQFWFVFSSRGSFDLIVIDRLLLLIKRVEFFCDRRWWIGEVWRLKISSMLSERLIGRRRRVRCLSSSQGSPFLNLSLNGTAASSAISTSTIPISLALLVAKLGLHFSRLIVNLFNLGSDSWINLWTIRRKSPDRIHFGIELHFDLLWWICFFCSYRTNYFIMIVFILGRCCDKVAMMIYLFHHDDLYLDLWCLQDWDFLQGLSPFSLPFWLQ